MRHHKKNRKFGREKNQRNALLRSLANSLILRQKITTTEAKAKELRKFVEPLVTRARTESLANRRVLAQRLGSIDSAARLLKLIAPKYKGRAGGYTRVIKLAPRASDRARMAVIEFV